MTKRVVFAGGVQAKALAKAYRLDIALDSDDDVYFIGADSIGREAAQKVVSAADILVTDLTVLGPTVPEAMIAVGTLRIAVPVVTADFLWPYASKAHPKNRYTAGLPDGPYPAGFGDSYLDILAEEDFTEDEAIARYLALDVAEDAALDRLLSDGLSIMRRLDAETGFDIAQYVESHFRSDYLFASRDRLNMNLFRHIATRLFAQMGVPRNRVTQLSDTFFPVGAMPIHPAVLRHFGMTSPAEDHRYPLLDEGYFSFETYCRRYWNYEFNRLLHAAIAKAESNPSEAIPELRLALETSPDSRGGLRALKDAERAVNDSTMLPTLSLYAPDPASRQAGEAASPALKSRTLEAGAEPGDEDERRASPHEPDESWHDDAEIQPPPSFIRKPVFGALVPRPSIAPDDDDDAVMDGPPAFTDFPLRESSASPALLSGLLRDHDMGIQDGALAQPVPDDAPEPQPQEYEELPVSPFGEEGRSMAPAPANARSLTGPGRYAPLPPAEHLIPLLPRLLPSARVLSTAADRAFTDMPETLPPPPLKPVLPPELHPESEKVSLMSRIMDQLRR